MSYAEALTRISELQARFGLNSYATTYVDTGTFDEVLMSAKSRFNSGPARITQVSNDVDPAAAAAAQGTRSMDGTARSGAATRGLTPELNDIFQRMSAKHDVPVALIKAVARAESGFRSDAVSPAGAQGIMQLMPATAKGFGVTDPFDPEQSIEAGAKYLRNALKIFNGDVKLALASYNAGVGAVKKYDGIPPYPETQNYVKKVLEYAREMGMRI